MRITTLGLLCMIVPMGYAQVEANIPDPELRQLLISVADRDNNSVISSDEAASLETLDAVGYNLNNLEGIDNFTALEFLYLRDNNISDIGPLVHLDKLQALDLSNNRIADVTPIAGMRMVWQLNLSGNLISDLSPLIENNLLSSGAIGGRPGMSVEHNLLSSGDCKDLLGLIPMGITAVYGSQLTGELDCVSATQLQAVRWVPHLTTPDGDFVTEVSVTNGNSVDENLTLELYSSEGVLLDTVPMTFKAGVTQQVDVQGLVDGVVSHFAVSGSEHCRVSLAYRAVNGVNPPGHVTETEARNKRYIAWRGESELVFDGAAVVNASRNLGSLLIRALEADGSVLNEVSWGDPLEPGEKVLLNFTDMFPDFAGDRFEVVSDQPIATLFLRGTHASLGASILYQSDEQLTLPVENSATRVIPHLTRGADFTTDLFLNNDLMIEGNLTLKGYAANGNPLGAKEYLVPSKGIFQLKAADLFDGEAAHIRAEGDDFVTVTARYRAAKGDAASAHVAEQTTLSHRFQMFPGDWDVVWDGAAVVNASPLPARVEVVRYSNDGFELERKVLSEALLPNHKWLGSFLQQFAEDQGRIEIIADQPIAVTFLRGSLSGSPNLLFQTKPLVTQ